MSAEPSVRAPATESVHTATHDLDLRDTNELVAALVAAQQVAFAATQRAAPAIARAVDAIAARLRAGGKLHYVGAGTSGRLGVLDAAECPPTFGTPPELVTASIAGGSAALTRAVEGAEDDAAAGRVAFAGVAPADAVVALSASGGAPYVVAALETARARGAYTVAITNDPRAPLLQPAACAIVLDTGPEALAGSTRLAAGTAQKLVLNALSTAVMVRLGKVYDNVMVDVVATNVKLRRRAHALVRTLAGVDDERANALLAAADGRVKVAVVMARRSVGANDARALLAERDGFLRPFLQD